MKLLPKDPVKTLIVIAYIIVAFLFVVFVLPHLVSYLLPFIVAALISAIITPAVNFMTDKMHINRRISTLVSIIAVLGIIGFVLFNIGNQIVNFVQGFVLKIPEMLSAKREIPGWVVSLKEYLVKFPEPMQNIINDIRLNLSSNISEILSPATSATLAFAGSTASKIPSMFVFTVVTILATYFMSYDKKRLKEFFKNHIDEKKINTIIIIKERLFQACCAYIRAQLIMLCIMFVILVMGYYILGVKSFIFMAAITAVIDAIPILGTGTILLPWAVISLIMGNYSFAVGLVIMYSIALLTRQFFEPKIVSTQMGLHPLITLISMYAGFMAVGILGMILGPIIAIVAIKAMEIYKESNKEAEQHDGEQQDTCG